MQSFAWAALSLGASRVAVFALTLILARILVPADFGLVAAGLAVLAFFEIGLDLGVGAALVYEQERGVSSRVQTAFTVNLIIATAMTAVGMAVAPVLAAFFQVPEETTLFRVLFLFLLFRGAGQVQDAVLRRDLRFRARTGLDGARAGVRFVVSIVLALLGAEVWALVWGLLAGEVAATVVAWRLVRFRPNFTLERTVARSLLSYGATVLALKVTGVVAANTDYLVVGNQLGPVALGVYSIAFRLPDLLLTNVYILFSTVAFPMYSAARTAEAGAFRSAVLRALRLLTLFGFTCGTGLAIVTPDALPMLFGEQWRGGVVPMVLLSLALGFYSVGYASGDVFAAAGRPGVVLVVAVPYAVVFAVALVLLAPAGLVAVAAAHLAFNIVYALVRLLLANRLVGSTLIESLRAMWPGTAAAVGASLAGVPVALGTGPGLLGVLATVAAGAAGALLALVVFARATLTEVARLAGHVTRA